MKRNSQAFVNQLVVCLIITIGFGGSVGLGTVWMRHQISTTANLNRNLHARLLEIQRLIDEKDAVIESEMRPELLRKLNDDMRLGLVPMNEVPLVNVPDDVARRLVERANRDLFDAPPPPITFTLAQH